MNRLMLDLYLYLLYDITMLQVLGVRLRGQALPGHEADPGVRP